MWYKAKRKAVKREKIDKRWENLWVPATVDWSYRANIFELGSRSDPTSCRCVVIGCLLMDLVMLIDSYCSMRFSLAASFSLCLISLRRKKTYQLEHNYTYTCTCQILKGWNQNILDWLVFLRIHFRAKASSDFLPFCTYLKDFHQVFSSTLLSYPSPTVLRSIASLSWTGAQFTTALLDRHIWKKMDGSNFNKVSLFRLKMWHRSSDRFALALFLSSDLCNQMVLERHCCCQCLWPLIVYYIYVLYVFSLWYCFCF